MIFGYLAEKIVFPKTVTVEEENGKLIVKLSYGKKISSARVNLPLLCNKEQVQVFADGVRINMRAAGKVMGAYGEMNLYVSSLLCLSEMKIQIEEIKE